MLIGGRDDKHAHTYHPRSGSATAVQELNAALLSSLADDLPAPVTGRQTVLPPRDEDAQTVSLMYTFASIRIYTAWASVVASAELIVA